MSEISINSFEKPYSIFKNNQNYFLMGLLLLVSFYFFRIPFFIVLFIILDFIVSYLDSTYKIDALFDFLTLGIITLSYSLNYGVGLILSLGLFPSRLILGRLEKRHFLKFPILILLAVLADVFSNYNIAILGFCLFVFRYILEYIIDFVITGAIDTRRIIRRILHIIAGQVYFSSIVFLVIALV